MEHREVDLESFLLRGRGPRDVNKDFSTRKDLEPIEIGDVEASGRDFEEEAKPTTTEAIYLQVENGKQFDALDKGFADGRSPSGWMKWMTMWIWIWGGSKYSGAACMAVSSASYSLMGLFVKLLSVRKIPSSEIIMFRCALISLVAGVALRRMKHPLWGTPRVRRLVLARSIIGFIAISAYFYSIQILPLRDATVLNFTSPVFTIILATVFLNETWSGAEAAGTFCSFLGVLLVTQPQILSAGHYAGTKSIVDVYVGVATALAAAALGALSYILVRLIGQHGEPPLVCVFAFAAVSTPMAALVTLFQGYKAPGAVEVSLLLLVGVLAYSAQVFLTRALQLEKASSVAPIQYLKVLFTFILGVMFLQEIPTAWDIFGAILIIGSATIISHKSSS
ncbi:unnamed protein product [Calypogeia fissa]